jgi:hypothetical protein
MIILVSSTTSQVSSTPYARGVISVRAVMRRSQFAATDYLIAQPFPVPERFHTRLVRDGGVQEKVPVVRRPSPRISTSAKRLYMAEYCFSQARGRTSGKDWMVS